MSVPTFTKNNSHQIKTVIILAMTSKKHHIPAFCQLIFQQVTNGAKFRSSYVSVTTLKTRVIQDIGLCCWKLRASRRADTRPKSPGIKLPLTHNSHTPRPSAAALPTTQPSTEGQRAVSSDLMPRSAEDTRDTLNYREHK